MSIVKVKRWKWIPNSRLSLIDEANNKYIKVISLYFYALSCFCIACTEFTIQVGFDVTSIGHILALGRYIDISTGKYIQSSKSL